MNWIVWTLIAKTQNLKPPLELEVDERLEFGGDELVYYKNTGDHDESHSPDGKKGEVDAVPLFPLLREPVNEHP